MEDEEEIPVKYRLSGETEWVVKNQAVMTLAKTKWAIRLKLCKQGDGHHYYSLHVVLLTPGHVSRVQIKCQREGAEKPDWLQKYTFGGVQTVLVNPCLMAVDHKDKITFSVEIRLLWDKEVPFEMGPEISFPNASYALKLGENKKLMVDHEYLKRRAPLLGYMFEDEEKKEYILDETISFQDLVDVFGALQHHWPFTASRLLELIPIARKLGFDLWGQSLNREFGELLYRNEPMRIVALEDEAPETFEFNEPLTWTIDDVSNLQPTTSSHNQNVFLTSSNSDRNCIIYVYTRDVGGQQFLSLGFQMSRASTSTSSGNSEEDSEEIDVITDSPDTSSGFFDIHIHLVASNGEKVFSDVIRRIPDDEYLIVGSPVFAKLEDVMKYKTIDDKLTIEFSWNESYEDRIPGEYSMPGLKNGQMMCEDTMVFFNKEFLAHNSPYFRGLFSDRFKESQMEILELPAECCSTMLQTLELIYNRRQTFDDVQYSRVLDFADRMCMSTVTQGLERQLWSCTEMSTSDKSWLAEQFLLHDLKIKCTMEQTEEELKSKRSSRKRPRPADFSDEPPEAPPQPVPHEEDIPEDYDEPIHEEPPVNLGVPQEMSS